MVIVTSYFSSFSNVHPVTYNQLFHLSQIREIDGYLLLERLNDTTITDLRFLRRLEVIHGRPSFLFFNVLKTTLIIQNNPHLQTLSLASLRRIENGGVRIQGNSDLCLQDTVRFEDYLVNSSMVRRGNNNDNCFRK